MMAEARAREAWDHTSQLLATAINIANKGQGRAVKAADLHPYHVAERPKMRVGIDFLIDMFR